MKKEVVIAVCGVVFIIMIAGAAFKNRNVQDGAENALHEITTFDMWKQSAYTTQAAYCPTPGSRQRYFAPQAAPVQEGGMQPGFIQQAAMRGAPAIYADQDKPILIKQFGTEVVPVGSGKVKITGVMGSSWADKAGLKAGDILLKFDTKPITSLKQFQALVISAPPEKSYRLTFLRGSRTKHCLVTVGEGEMEGFAPIVVPK